jgi:hypothetical protein
MNWNEQDKKHTVAQALGVKVKEPWTVKEAIKNYVDSANEMGDNYYWTLARFAALTKKVNPLKRLDSVTIGDLVNEDKSIKGAIVRVVRFAATGSITNSPKKTEGNTNGDKHSGQFSFRVMPASDLLKLIPSAQVKGKYGIFKLQVQEFVASLPKDKGCQIDEPKNAKANTIGIILSEVNQMLKEGRKDWQLHHNPLHKVFILAPNTTKGA